MRKIPLQYRESHANRKGANFKAGWPLSMLGPNRRARFSVPHPCALPNRLEKSAAADLFLVNFKGIAILHFKRIGGIVWLDSLALKEKADRIDSLALALAKGAHELLKLSRLLYLEKDLVVVVRHLNVQVLRLRGGLRALRGRGAVLVLVGRHCGGCRRRG